MRLINQSYEILGTPKSLEEAWAFAAMAARNCYQSEKTKLDESEEDFCRRILIKHPDDHECDHMSPLEFGIVYLCVEYEFDSLAVNEHYKSLAKRYYLNPYSRCKSRLIHTDEDLFNTPTDAPLKSGKVGIYITTNLRVIIENGWEDDLKYAGSPTEHHVKACAFHLTTNRAIMCELTRHEAALSFTCESTRYCNYSKGKFGNELTFIKPCWSHCKTWDGDAVEKEQYELAIKDGGINEHMIAWYDHTWDGLLDSGNYANQIALEHLRECESSYLDLIKEGWTPQQAATILPNALKVSIMMCGYEDSLQHVFRLRAEECSGPVHPQMAELMKPLYEDYKNFNE